MSFDTEPEKVLSGDTPIHVKFIGWLVIVCAGGFGGWIWWAATISTKLDAVLQNQAANAATMVAIKDDVSRLKEWKVQIDTVGSPTLLHRVDMLQDKQTKLEQEFDLHKATTVTKP